MSAEEAQDNAARQLDGPVSNEPDAIEGKLMDRIGPDARLDSGIPEDQRGGDLDFVEMSGITLSPPLPDPSPADAPSPNANDPLGFYEAGVIDVDGAMEAAAEKTDLSPGKMRSPSADSFREIAEGLSEQNFAGAKTSTVEPDGSPSLPRTPDAPPFPRRGPTSATRT